MSGCTIRPAAAADAIAIAAIYAHHVLHGTATFDTEPPPREFWTDKIAALTARGWPFLVAETDDAVTGYAYATQFRDRAAYARTCENSIYIRADSTGRRIGISADGRAVRCVVRQRISRDDRGHRRR